MIIDPDEKNNSILKDIFSRLSIKMNIVTPGFGFLVGLKNQQHDCVLINSELPDNQAIRILDKIKWEVPNMIVIILLNKPNINKIIEFVRHGADDFIQKPFTFEDIEKILTYYYY